MADETYDAVIIGSGAGGAAVAYNLVKAGKRVLMLEKGDFLPRDCSTMDVRTVFKEGKFKNHTQWVDNQNRTFVPDEYYNVGGKTKWYGAALTRFKPHEFEADEGFQCLAWPIRYVDLEPYYRQAEDLLQVQQFDNEVELQKLIDKIASGNSEWRSDPLPLGLKKEILQDEHEAKHFDGFASMSGYKFDAEVGMINRIADDAKFTLLPNKNASGFLHDENAPEKITGVKCTDGSSYPGKTVVLAAGAMTSPRLLQDYLEQTGLAQKLPFSAVVGANFKLHLNSALLAFSPFSHHDILRKTAIFYNDKFPHSTVQCLGWVDGEILASQLPAAVPKFVANAMGRRAYGFFVTTEDGSSPQNRIISCGGHGGLPVMDYDFSRIERSHEEHQAVVRAFEARLLRAGLLGVSKYMGLAGTAHAMGSLVAGTDPEISVVSADGKVHGMINLYVGDGSVLPRAGRVNPALTIFAWGLRLGRHLGEK
jgi:choline dehydrogenase-like flavoprotein